PRKRLGQNFLTSRAILERIVDAAQLSPQDLVLEVGPGLGALSLAMAPLCGGLIAVELDERFIPPLREILAPFPQVRIVQGDILRMDIAELLKGSGFSSPPLVYKVVSNLPYYATSAIIRHLLEARKQPELLVLTVQKEVAERIVAGPGDMSLLAVSVQFYGRPQIVAHIGRGAFYPAPEVDSATLRIDIPPSLPLPEGERSAFFRVVRAGFGQARKQLRNSLSAGLRIPAEVVADEMARAGFDPRGRAQELGVEEWVALYRALSGLIGGKGEDGPGQ
ncbi:MAG: 16S rRNA (adenine(1518)-N(6)/adenine(1519)-N(6))-dimethyltransferase RsmA, partial [Chloroflexota bacterium]|nr:16S rRNA (adenine(1518)-N(6)/adenine(1519)-N(6))-dimethyltransferase RsmA [Chloroflexota bacterium]